MRKLSAGLFMSVDGVVESPDRFVFPYFSDEVGQAVGAGMEASDAVLLGRRTYEEWAEYWPGKTADDDPFAPYINEIQKFVVSTTLERVEWHNSTLLTGDVGDAIRELKQGPGRNIQISGSITLTGSLLRMRELDELGLLVFPVVVGSGKRLFQADQQVPLQLVDSKTLGNGVQSLTYGPAAA